MANIPVKNNAVSGNFTVTLPQGSSASTISIVGGGGGSGGITYGHGATWGHSTAKSSKMHIQGDATFDGDITWQGRNMREWFESVEARLALLHPNPELEKDWAELAELRMRYIDLERQMLEKQQVFDILKKT
jgi:hypothetical protein